MTPLSPTIIERAAEASFAEFNKTYGVETAWADAPDYVQDEVRRFTRAALQSAIPEAVAEEREACAKIAEMFSINKTPIHPDVPWIAMGDAQRHVAHMTCQCMAKAIRARSAEQKGEGNG